MTHQRSLFVVTIPYVVYIAQYYLLFDPLWVQDLFVGRFYLT